MKVYCVGDELNEFDEGNEEFVWLVYDYEGGSWEGSGEAVALGKDGLLYSWNLGHCSCYGPADEWPDGADKETIEQFVKAGESVLDDHKDAVRLKVESLLR